MNIELARFIRKKRLKVNNQFMTDKEIEDLKKEIEKQKKEITKSREAPRSFLVETGIFTKSGSLTRNYKNLRIIPGYESKTFRD